MDEFYEEIQSAVESSLVQEMCLAAVGEAEGMELTEEEYNFNNSMFSNFKTLALSEFQFL